MKRDFSISAPVASKFIYNENDKLFKHSLTQSSYDFLKW